MAGGRKASRRPSPGAESGSLFPEPEDLRKPERPERPASGGHVLVTGGAGSGKTCMLGRPRGGEVLAIVPSGGAARVFAAMVMGRAGAGALVGPRLLTLGSLAREVLAAAGDGRGAPELPSAARRDFIAALARAADGAGRLGVLAGSSRLAGFLLALERLVSELRSAGVSAGDFARALTAAAGDMAAGEERGLFAAKAADLAALYAAYEERLAASGLDDAEGAMRRAAGLLASGRAGLPGGARVVLLDGFARFTAAQELLVSAALARAAESMAALCYDGNASGRLAHVREAWAAVRAARRDWREERLEVAHRFGAPDLAGLEARLFSGNGPGGARAESVEAVAAAGAQAECEEAARRAARLVRDEGFRPGEIAVLARSLAAYAPHLERAFRLAGLPLDLAEGRPLRDLAAAAELGLAMRAARSASAGEFARWLGAAAEADGAGALIEALRGPLATAAERAGAAEIAALAAADGIADAGALEDGSGRLSPSGRAVLAAGLRRCRALSGLLPEEGAAAPGRWAEAAGRCLEALEPGRRILALGWPEAVVRRELAGLEALRAALAAVGPAAERAGLGQVGLGDFLELLEAALAGRSLPAAPPRSGAVLAANVFESRAEERRAVFVLGVADGSFPRDAAESPLLGDRERRLLAPRGVDLPLAAAAAERERYLFYIACTRARERLCLCSPQPGGAGRGAGRGAFLDEAAAAFAPGSLRLAEAGRGFPPVGELAWRGEALGLLAAAFNSPRPDGEAAGAHWRQALALHGRLRAAGGLPAGALARLAPRRSPPGELVDGRARRALAQAFAVQTASALAAFGNCPFANFLQRGLGLAARRRLEFDARLAGDVLHAALRRAYAAARDGGELPAPSAAGALLREALRADFPGLSGRPQTEAFLAAQEPLLRRLLAEDGERLRSCGTRPARLELTFGGGRSGGDEDAAGSGRGLPLGEGLRLRGRIDRVDLLGGDGNGAALVIDYKRSLPSGWKRDPQVLLYALALREVFGMEPAGAGLLGLRGAGGGRRTAGLVRPEFRARLAAYGFSAELTDAILEEARAAAAELARRAAGGDVRVWPVSCAGCPDKEAYNPICRFDGAEWRAEHGWAPEDEGEGEGEGEGAGEGG